MSVLIEPPPTTPTPPAAREPSIARGLWKAFAALLVIGTFVSGTFQVLTLLAHEERTEVTPYDAAGVARIDIDNSAGSVRVVGSDRQSIEVTARISDGLRATGESQEVVGDALYLRGTCPNWGSDWCGVSYTVEVPSDLDVRIDADDGSVEVTGISGTVEVDTDNGVLELADLGGRIRATNDNGRIVGNDLSSRVVSADTDNGRIALAFIAPPEDVVATSNNGSVEVVVPDDGSVYRLVMDTDNGSRREEIDVDDSSARSIVIRTDNGSVSAITPTSR